MTNNTGVIKAVLFDLDGTLLDTSGDLLQSLNELVARYHIKPQVISDDLWPTLGKGGRFIVNTVFKLDNNDPRLDQLTTEFNCIYQKKLHATAQFFPGIYEVLIFLTQCNLPWGIVTNRAKSFTLPFPKHLSLLTQAHCVVCGSDVTHPKPHPEPLLNAAKLINTQAEQCAYLGDSYEDWMAASKAAMITLFANYGFSAPEAKKRNITPDYIIDNPLQLIKLIQKHR